MIHMIFTLFIFYIYIYSTNWSGLEFPRDELTPNAYRELRRKEYPYSEALKSLVTDAWVSKAINEYGTA